MIAERYNVRAGLQQIFQDLFRNAKAAGGVFAVNRDEVEFVTASKHRQSVKHSLAPCTADHITEEQKSHQTGTHLRGPDGVSTQSRRSS